MNNLTIYSGGSNAQTYADYQKKRFRSPAFKANPNEQQTQVQNQQSVKVESQTTQNTKKKWTGRDYTDAATLSLYAAIVGTAVAIRMRRSPDRKAYDAYAEATKELKASAEELMSREKLKSEKFEVKEGGKGFKIFDQFGKWKENSEELTNNIVYGFGTLVIMPLVIMFSPIGKKDASKDDRFFTILRQPISFATLFTMQLTFEKIFKALKTDIDEYGLLDKKVIDGKEVFYSKKRMKEALKDMLGKDKNGAQRDKFGFNIVEKIKDGKTVMELNSADAVAKKNAEPFLEIIKNFVLGVDTQTMEGKIKVPVKCKGLGNNFNIDDFVDYLVKMISSMGENPVSKKDGKVINKIENLKPLIEHYHQDYPELLKTVENMCYGQKRCKALVQTTTIVSNCIFSQALGIMTLNFVYGKMMKKIGKNRTNDSVQESGKGGVK